MHPYAQLTWGNPWCKPGESAGPGVLHPHPVKLIPGLKTYSSSPSQLIHGMQDLGCTPHPAGSKGAGSWQGDNEYRLHPRAQSVKTKCRTWAAPLCPATLGCRTQERGYRILDGIPIPSRSGRCMTRMHLIPSCRRCAGQKSAAPRLHLMCSASPGGARSRQVDLAPPMPSQLGAQDLETGCWI